MEEITLKCRTITPIFCYGANKNVPELRPPSFKGALRFWWRAIHSNLDLNTMKQKEMDFFGGIKGNKSVKSPFSLRIKHLDFNSIKEDALPHKPNKYKATAIPVDTKFDLVLSQKVRDECASLFFLLSILGGIGGRSRRGFGCFEIDSSKYENIKINVESEDVQIEIKEKIIKKINPQFEFEEYKRSYPYIKKILIGKSYDSYKELLKKIGESSHENNSDYKGRIKPSRYASPVYVSIYKDGENFYPIITELNRTIDNTSNHEEDEKNKNQFIQDILGKG
jgi:CRISPR-associated protein Cmr1